MNRSALKQAFDRIDETIVGWMTRHGVDFLRISLGVVFLWFGALKFFPGLSPAQDLAMRTMDVLTFGLVPNSVALLLLASWESLIGIGLLANKFMRITLLLLFVQMLGTVTPILLFPSEVFVRIPYAPTLEGQYIIKNMVLVSAGITIGATVRSRTVTAAHSPSSSE